MKRIFLITICLLAGLSIQAEIKFFVNDNGLRDVPQLEDKAKLLHELGYAGICSRPNVSAKKMLTAFEPYGLDILATYVTLKATDTAVPEHVVKHFVELQGQDTLVWLMLLEKDASDQQTVSIIQRVCDAAAPYGLTVVLYAHVGCRTSTIEECDRLRILADRPGLGISFNLCHFLRQHENTTIESSIQTYAPHIKLVQINGADDVPMTESNWDYLIKPLGEGTLDAGRVIRALDAAGYTGPVNLQCYRINQPAREHLSTSMKAWKEFQK